MKRRSSAISLRISRTEFDAKGERQLMPLQKPGSRHGARYAAIRMVLSAALLCLVTTSSSPALQRKASASASSRILLGQMAGSSVSFTRFGPAAWVIEVSENSGSWIVHRKSAQIEIFRSEGNTNDLAECYDSVRKEPGGIATTARVADRNGAAFLFTDRWKIADDLLIVSRTVTVSRGDGYAGFYSAIRFSTAPTVSWQDLDYLAPGVLYGDRSHVGDSAPGGTLNYGAKRFEIREDWPPLEKIVLEEATRRP